MSADPDIERMVSEFADLLRRRLYQQRDMYSAALAAQAQTVAADLERIWDNLQISGQLWLTTVELSPEVATQTTQTNCEEPSSEEPSIEPSWVVPTSTTSSISIDSIDFVYRVH